MSGQRCGPMLQAAVSRVAGNRSRQSLTTSQAARNSATAPAAQPATSHSSGRDGQQREPEMALVHAQAEHVAAGAQRVRLHGNRRFPGEMHAPTVGRQALNGALTSVRRSARAARQPPATSRRRKDRPPRARQGIA